MGVTKTQSFQQRKGFGHLLYQAIINMVKVKGVTTIFLITTKAADFFAEQGFTNVDRSLVPKIIQNTAQFSSVCPATATFMYKKIS